MGYLKQLVDYGRSTERDRQRLVMEYRHTEAGFILVLAILLTGLVCGLAWLDHRDQQGISKQERARKVGTALVLNKEEFIR